VRRRLTAIATVAALAATVAALGGALRSSPGGEALAAARASTQPRDARGLTLLGLEFQQRARETGDASYYPRSERALKRALRLAPNEPLAVTALGSLALSRHRFREALTLGRRGGSYAVVGDALVELGRYDEAFRAFDELAATKPGLASYARVSYARELLGRPREAIAAMELAVEAATGQAEPTAWTRVQLGKLHWSLGRLDAAASEYRQALTAFPGYVHALDAFAQVESARGHVRAAIALERRAVSAMPLPQFAAFLGDLYRSQGRLREARRQYDLVAVIQRLLVANGVRTDLETALIAVDHGLRLPHALALARAARNARPSIEGDDALAWALARNGRCHEALGYSRRALRLGTRDALKFFHRAMIERCIGSRTARGWFRRALSLNPHFSLLWAPVARKALQ
jgi:tetratricopeptide (TPR) repeat protein